MCARYSPIALAFLVAFALASLTPSLAAAEGCREVSNVVGERKCSTYGDGWSVERREPITFRFGMRFGEFSTEDRTWRESFKSTQRRKGYVGYSYPGTSLGTSSLTGLGSDGGLTWFVIGQLYVGVEGGVLLGSVKTPSFQTARHALSDASGVDVQIWHAGAPIGYRIPLGRASLRGEVLFGGAMAFVSHAVVGDGAPPDSSASAARGLIETRAAADIWFTQHITFSAYAGLNVLDERGRAFGLSLTWHHRAFDGDMSLW